MGDRGLTDEHFAAFVVAQSDSLLRTAMLLTRNNTAAEELLQDTLVRLYPSWPVVMASESALAYVRRSLINRFLSHRRRLTLASRVSGQASTSGSDMADQVADSDQLRRLLAQLPDRQRAALVLRYFHDLTDQQAADTLGCKVGTLRSLISRALHTLRTDAGSIKGADA